MGNNTSEARREFRPYVSAETRMPEFTLRALILGLIMSVILGAANAYLGLKAGMTIAATYPAAVIGMAILRLMRGSSWKRISPARSAPLANPWRQAPSSQFQLFISLACGRSLIRVAMPNQRPL